MQYNDMKKNYMHGWHTWNVWSINSYVHMPDGLALNLAFKEYTYGRYYKEMLLGNSVVPGLHSFDGRYADVTLSITNMDIHVESAADGDEIVLLVTPVNLKFWPAMLVLETGYLWGRPGWIEKIGENEALAHDPQDRPIFITGKPAYDPNVDAQNTFLSVELSQPICISTGKQRTVSEARALLDKCRSEVEARTQKYGELSGLYQAVECTLAWDTIYDAKNDRIISPVSRQWSIGAGGYIIFCWDNFFAGFMGSMMCKELAYSNLREVLRPCETLGFVPNYAYGTGMFSMDRSQPPVGSAMLVEVYRKFREKWIVEEMYPLLLKWNTWFLEHRSAESGALCWGSDPIPVVRGNMWEYEDSGVNGSHGAALESGLDNSPMYDDMPFDKEKHIMQLEDVGLTGLYIKDCISLIELAKLIGRESDIPELEKRLARAEAGLEGMWDDENGFYYNRRTDTGEFSRRISPTNFYALFSSAVSDERARRMADEHYYNPDEFYGDWMLPSIARNDPGFKDQDYWRGRVWAPLNFLVYLALQNTSLDDVRHDLAEKSKVIFLKEWNEKGHVHENYNSITGEGCDVGNSDCFYHWGALLPVVALAEAGNIEGLGKPLL